jgi:hypothetical protein
MMFVMSITYASSEPYPHVVALLECRCGAKTAGPVPLRGTLPSGWVETRGQGRDGVDHVCPHCQDRATKRIPERP